MQPRTVECLHCVDKILGISGASGFTGGVHGKLCGSDVHSGNGNLRVGEIAKGRASGDIRAVDKGLEGNPVFLANVFKDCRRYAVGGVLLRSIVFD